MNAGARPWILAAAISAVQAQGSALAASAERDAPTTATAEVVLSDCPQLGLGRRTLFDAIQLEFEHDGWSQLALVHSRNPDAPVTVQVTLSCFAHDAQALLSIDGAPLQVMQRHIRLSDLPLALRARAVALAAAELARSAMPVVVGPSEDQDSQEPTLPYASAPEARRSTPNGDAGNLSDSGNQPEGATSLPKKSQPVVTGAATQASGTRAPIRPESTGSIAVGPTLRGFVPSPGLIYGGRLVFAWGRLHVGAEYLTDDPVAASSPTGLGVLAGFAGGSLFSSAYGAWRFTAGPRVTIGRTWSGQWHAAGSSVSADASAAPSSTPMSDYSHLYLEVSGHAGATIRVGSVWILSVGIESGIAYGVQRTGSSVNFESAATLATLGGCLLAGYQI